MHAQATLPPETVEVLDFGRSIVLGVRKQVDLYGFFGLSDGFINSVPGAVGNNGIAVFTSLNGNSTSVLGTGVAGSISSSFNQTITANLAPFGLGGQTGTQVSGTTSISWTTGPSSDGSIHISVTITIGTNLKTITRTIDIKTIVPAISLKPRIDSSLPEEGTGTGGGGGGGDPTVTDGGVLILKSGGSGQDTSHAKGDPYGSDDPRWVKTDIDDDLRWPEDEGDDFWDYWSNDDRDYWSIS